MLAQERRSFFKKNLSSLYLPYYEALCSKLGPEWQPYSGMRDFASQNRLYAQGRSTGKLGKAFTVTNAKGGQSAHNYGAATDWTYFEGETLLWLKKEDPRWGEYLKAVEAVGLRSGSSWGDIDHNELKLSCDWPHIELVYSKNGMRAAQEHIQANLIPSPVPQEGLSV